MVRLAGDTPQLRLAGVVLLVSFALLAWTGATPHIRASFAVILAVSGGLAWAFGVPESIPQGFARALVFGAFLPAVVMLRTTIERSPRLERLRRDIAGLEAQAAEAAALHGSHALGSVMNAGAASILAPVMTKAATEERRAAFASACTRGVAIAGMWSPFYLSIAFTTQLVPGVPVWQVIGLGAATGALGLVLSHLFITRSPASTVFAALARLRLLAAPAITAIGAVVAASIAFGWNGLHAVAIVVPVLCLAYAAALGRRVLREVLARTFRDMARISNELLIVTGAAVLGAVVGALPAVQALARTLSPQLLSGTAILGALVAVILALGQLGLHPMIASGVLVPILCAGDFGASHAVILAAAVFAWTINATASPWTVTLLLSASAFGVPVRRLLTKQSYGYLVLYAIAAVAFLGAVNALLRLTGR